MVSKPVGSVLMVGGGIAGIQSSLDLAEMGFKVHLVETLPSIGGKMAQLDKTFPTNDCAMCTISPKLVETGRHLNIEILTDTEVFSWTVADNQPPVLTNPGSQSSTVGDSISLQLVATDGDGDPGHRKRLRRAELGLWLRPCTTASHRQVRLCRGARSEWAGEVEQADPRAGRHDRGSVQPVPARVFRAREVRP